MEGLQARLEAAAIVKKPGAAKQVRASYRSRFPLCCATATMCKATLGHLSLLLEYLAHVGQATMGWFARTLG